MENEKPNRGLSRIEIAALTACVPCSGSPEIDKIISVALKYRTSCQLLEGILASGYYNPQSGPVLDSLSLADKLLAQFHGRKLDGQETAE